ncbi:hypothetical protein GE061_003662 [Apolygus lucorum]|uniref:Uncharacterized protein n=1 Tax=Apolygus lucorum TaxID=248454 RepID=A0A8S9X434_APOLU|nr:hypothetical protein GE061_003662 [Apolygus lucorum]
MKWSALVIVAYLGLPFCSSLVKRIRPQEYLAIQSSCEKWFVIFINSWCWNTLLIDDFVFRLRSLLYNLEGVANIGVIDGVADAGFYNLFGYGGTQFVQLIDPPCSNVALLRNPNVRNLLPYFDPQKITRELISLVGVYERDGCKLQKSAVQEKPDTSAIFDSCHFWVVFETSKIDQSSYDRCYNDYTQLARHFEGDFKFAFVPSTDQQTPGCMVSVYGMNKEQPARFNLVSNGMTALYGVPSYLDEYRSRYRPCSTLPWNPVDLYDVMTSCKFWILISVAQDSDWPCVREIEKFAVYSKDKFEFGTIKGSTFGVWLFLENKLMPVLAMSDSATCQVPVVFDIIKGQMNKVLPPPTQVCDNYATSPYEVETIAVLNQKKLMDSWDNWLVLQASPFHPSYPAVFAEFKKLFNQFKGSLKFGFIPNSQFGLWLYGNNKNWPYSITSDPNDFQTQRYVTLLLDILKGRQSPVDNPRIASPYLGDMGISQQNYGGNLVQPQVPPQIPQQVPYFPNAGSWDFMVTPKTNLFGTRGFEFNNNDNSNALQYSPSTEKTVNESPGGEDCKDCGLMMNQGEGDSKVYYGSRGLDSGEAKQSGEEYILEPVLNLTSIPDKWKLGLNELFTNSKDLVVKVSFPSPVKKRTETADVKQVLDSGRVVSTSTPSTSSAQPKDLLESDVMSGARFLGVEEQTTRIITTFGNTNVTENVIKQVTETISSSQSTSESGDVTTISSGVREIGDAGSVTAPTIESRTETVDVTAGSSIEPSTAETSSQSPPPETSVATAERSADVGVNPETSTAEVAETPKPSNEGEIETSTVAETAATESTQATEVTSEITTSPEESSKPPDTASMSSSNVSLNSGADLTNASSKQRIIETTDVETVRKDCKFWVLISSSEDAAMDEKYEQCYEKLTTVMSNYKNVYKFGAVHAGEFFINLYLKNKSNPISISSDYSCDEDKLKSALDAHKAETPGEFCQDPEDVSDYE